MSSAYKNRILELDNVSFGYPQEKNKIIHNLSVSIETGEFIGMLGANGSGKSTILKIANGILKPTEGSVNLWNKPIQTYKNKDRAKLVSYLPQMLDINLPFRVKELVSMGLYPYDIAPSLSVDDALEMTGMKNKSDLYLKDLSGGETRRVFIAMTLLQGSGLLLLDEPLANLDIKYQIEVIRLLKELQQNKDISIIMALHDINMAFEFEKIMLIKNGGILGFSSPENLLTTEMLKEAFDVELKIMRRNNDVSFIMERR
ncbi:MAG: ABC transporter ATP-binding protein [Nitrospiraceae bacterium]|nr:ABC transporter ATP-binding protein [Nitrospiraceae bacterium]